MPLTGKRQGPCHSGNVTGETKLKVCQDTCSLDEWWNASYDAGHH